VILPIHQLLLKIIWALVEGPQETILFRIDILPLEHDLTLNLEGLMLPSTITHHDIFIPKLTSAVILPIHQLLAPIAIPPGPPIPTSLPMALFPPPAIPATS